jgi:hypothetical protein
VERGIQRDWDENKEETEMEGIKDSCSKWFWINDPKIEAFPFSFLN